MVLITNPVAATNRTFTLTLEIPKDIKYYSSFSHIYEKAELKEFFDTSYVKSALII